MFTQSSFLYNGPKLEKPIFPSIGEWKNKLGYINTTEYYLAVKMDKLLIYVTTWMNFTITILEEARHRRAFVV